MFTQAIPCGRRRTLDRQKKQHFCDTIARGATMTEAAVALGVSLRTVQREARRDADFDRELRTAHQAPPDLHQLMKSHARSHWRAGAWLLEREDPERYGRRSASSCGPFQFHQGLRAILEAALEAAPVALRSEIYEHVHAACEAAFKRVFPTYGPCGRRLAPSAPPTPLADAEHIRNIRNGGGLHVFDVCEQEPDALATASSENQTKPDPQLNSSGPLPLESEENVVAAAMPSDRADANAADANLQPPASPGGRAPSTQTAPHQDAAPGRSPGLKDDDAKPFKPRLSHRYALRTAATLHSLFRPDRPRSESPGRSPGGTDELNHSPEGAR